MTTQRRTWRQKFADALRGLRRGVRGQSSFFVHFFCAAAVIAAGVALRITIGEWIAVSIAITMVLVAEMFNSAIETLVKALVKKHDPLVGEALDISSAGVLLASIGAVVIGVIVFGPYLWTLV